MEQTESLIHVTSVRVYKSLQHGVVYGNIEQEMLIRVTVIITIILITVIVITTVMMRLERIDERKYLCRVLTLKVSFVVGISSKEIAMLSKRENYQNMFISM